MTTIRFAYGDRGTGQIKAPYLNALNLRVGRNFVLGPLRLDVAIDIFKSAERRHRSAVLRWCNQIYSSNYAPKPNRSFFGVNRQPPRAGQLTVRVIF